MTLIKNQRFYPSKRPHAKPALLMCGYGGRIWQVRLLVRVLNRAGYDVTALDFSASVLNKGDERLLPDLVRETAAFAEAHAKQAGRPVLLVGVSLGSLLALNIIRRSSVYSAGVLITGGDIARIARKLYPHKWKQSYADLAAIWRDVNMYSAPAQLIGKRVLFVVHRSSRLIQVQDVYAEADRQQRAGNSLQLVERRAFDHIGTIVMETIIWPSRVLSYIRQVEV